MTRMIRGSVLLAACVGLWSCTSDPTSDEAGKPFKIVSLPSVVFIKQDSSQLVAFQLVDELDGQIPETWTLSGNTAFFNVALDSSFRPVYNSDGTLTLPEKQTEVRATLTGTDIGVSSFTVSAGGKSLVIPVNVIPGAIRATFSPANPAPGDTVTMTMPLTLRLSPSSVITFPGNLAPVALTIAADSQSATFISAPTTDTTATVTLVTSPVFPALPAITANTQDKVTGTQSGTWTGKLPATIAPASSPGAPVVGNIAVTLNPVYAFKCDPTCANVDPSVFTFPTQTAPILAGVSADSTVATLTVGPNVASPLQVTRITFKGAPQFEYSLVSADSVYSTAVADFPATLSNYTPQIGEAVTLTAGAGFTFNTALGTVSWPLIGPAIVTARTANTITLYPIPGSAGSPSAVSGVISAAAPAFQLTIPAVLPTPLAMQATVAPGMAGTGSYATAPTIGVQGVVDAGTWGGGADCGLPCQIYKITVAAAGPKTFTVTWDNNADVGLYFLNAGLSYILGGGCDAHGAGAGAGPETCTVTFPAAGTYYLEVDDFSPFYGPPNNVPPSWITLRFN